MVMHLSFCIVLLFVSCVSQTTAPVNSTETEKHPESTATEPLTNEVVVNTDADQDQKIEPIAQIAVFDPSTITKEVFDSTKTEVQALIEKLNQIIRDKNYDAWVQYLSPGYLAELSDPEFLKKTSESTRLKNQKIVLNSVKDYFLYVVVPSRANDRVDDIEFIGQNRVKAYTITNKGQRLRLYELEKTAGNWNIVN